PSHRSPPRRLVIDARAPTSLPCEHERAVRRRGIPGNASREAEGTGPVKPRQPPREPAGKGAKSGGAVRLDRCEPAEQSAQPEGSMYATHLICKGCQAHHPLDARFACDRCFGPLETAYDHAAIVSATSREQVMAGPATLCR